MGGMQRAGAGPGSGPSGGPPAGTVTLMSAYVLVRAIGCFLLGEKHNDAEPKLAQMRGGDYVGSGTGSKLLLSTFGSCRQSSQYVGE
jgi:hypothetical protein